MTDREQLAERGRRLDERLEIVAKGSVLKTRTAFIGFLVMTGLLLAILGGVVGITLDTNQAVKDRAVLEDRNAELEDNLAVQEDLLRQSTDAIVLLLDMLQQNGITPPEIVIRPPEDEDPEEGQ